MSDLEKRVLIVGCGRSGTKYAATLITNLGLDVPHEVMGKDGIATWCMAVDCEDSPWGGGRRGIAFKTILHQVRHPLKVIPSFTTANKQSWKFIERYVPISADEPVLLRATKYWYYWNLESERAAQWTYRVEDLNNIFPEFCARLGVNADYGILQKTNTSINTRKPSGSARPRSLLGWLARGRPAEKTDESFSYTGEPFTWAVLEKHAPGWSSRIMDLARRYGYSVEDDHLAEN